MGDGTYHHGSGEIVIGCEIAAWAGMPCDLIMFIVVYSFENIYFKSVVRF